MYTHFDCTIYFIQIPFLTFNTFATYEPENRSQTVDIEKPFVRKNNCPASVLLFPLFLDFYRRLSATDTRSAIYVFIPFRLSAP